MSNPCLPKLNGHPLTKKYVLNVILVMGLSLMSAGLYLNKAFAVPSEPNIVDQVTIQHPGNGFASSYTLPIYQVEDIRFLSAGVGIEERKATYPPFPLKLIFAQTDGAFIAGVSVSIKDQAGKEVATISKDQISGPWLFLDLTPGTYHITAVRKDGPAINQDVRLREGEKKITHLHWPAHKARK